MKKRYMMIAAAMTLSMAVPVFAAGWQQGAGGWWYATNDAGTTWYSNEWQWIDGNGDGIAECYYFDGNGYILSNATTPDGFTVNADGAWVENGVVQVQSVTVSADSGQVSADRIDALLKEHYKNDPNDPNLTVMEGTVDGDYYRCSVRSGVPGNPNASQRMYEVEVNMKTGEVKEDFVLLNAMNPTRKVFYLDLN